MIYQIFLTVGVSLLIINCSSHRETHLESLSSNTETEVPNVSDVIDVPCSSEKVCEIHTAISKVRTDVGLQILPITDACQKAAQAHAEDMSLNNYFAHTGLDGSSPTDRFRLFGGQSGAGENIARSGPDVDETVNLWMNSPGHRANILSNDYIATGIGYAADGGYWVQCFQL